LLICDPIKFSLTEGALQYVLSLENQQTSGWLLLDDLSRTLDVFYTSHGKKDKPRMTASAVCDRSVVGISPPPPPRFPSFFQKGKERVETNPANRPGLK